MISSTYVQQVVDSNIDQVNVSCKYLSQGTDTTPNVIFTFNQIVRTSTLNLLKCLAYMSKQKLTSTSYKVNSLLT